MQYTITGIHREDGAIAEVRLVNGRTMRVDEVITSIGNKNEYQTRDKNGNTAKVNVADKEYLRANPNKITADNLGEMVEY
ncbi:MAG: DUF3892 domain-containing protein [Thaumarchaeota archaeon]|nr:DUF3892 domain-containing protein [Nitrososphaerota archaeon]